MFRELLEASISASKVEKVIKKVDLTLLSPKAYEVEAFDTDAGMGGEKLVKVYLRSTRAKDKTDNDKVIKALQANFNVEVKDDLLIVKG